MPNTIECSVTLQAACKEPDTFYDFRKLTVALTTNCNLRCRMCPAIRSESASLPRDKVLHMVDFARRRGFQEIEIGGGEPTLMPYFWDMLDALNEFEIVIKVLTNGYRLTPEQIQRMASYPRLMAQISLDGVGAVHDAIRGAEGAFDATERSLRALAGEGCTVCVNTTVQHSNWRNMPELYERIKDLPLRWMALNPVELWQGHDESILPDEIDDVIETLEEVMRRGQRDQCSVSLTPDLLMNFRLLMKYPGAFIMHPGEGCTVVKRGLSIIHDGSVIPCWHNNNWDHNSAGRNINNRSLDDIVDDPIIRAEIERTIGPDGCRGCSTMCYNWDPDFQEKVMRPNMRLKLRRAPWMMREYLKRKHPRLFSTAKAIRWGIVLRRPPG